MPEPVEKRPVAQDTYDLLAPLYNERAPTKDYNAHYDRPATLSLMPDVRGKRVLDAGSGPGIYSEWLVEHGAEVVAFDVSPRMIEFFKQRLGERATVFQADLEEPLPSLEDERFDVVLCALALDYVHDWRPTFREFARVLRHDGLFVCSIGHPAADYFIYHNQGNYFEREQVVEQWSFGGDLDSRGYIEVTRYRHPLGHLFEALSSAGLALERFLEARPTQAFKEQNPERYEELMRRPGFLSIRARKGCPRFDSK